jgi:hypothetical protein
VSPDAHAAEQLRKVGPKGLVMETNKRNYRNLFVIKNNYYGKIMRIMAISFREKRPLGPNHLIC